MAKISLYIVIIYILFTHHSYSTNLNNAIHSCIYNNPEKLNFEFTTEDLISFVVFFISNTQQNCINPSFPAIHIKTAAKHNAWLHIVYTDSKIKDLQVFTDSENPLQKNSIYPFYTLEADFYDAPFWTYSFFNKPLSYWQGQAFALAIDHQNKTVKCLGGIEWGFNLPLLKTKPIAIMPKLVSQNDWSKAWQIVQEKLPGYSVVKIK